MEKLVNKSYRLEQETIDELKKICKEKETEFCGARVTSNTLFNILIKAYRESMILKCGGKNNGE